MLFSAGRLQHSLPQHSRSTSTVAVKQPLQRRSSSNPSINTALRPVVIARGSEDGDPSTSQPSANPQQRGSQQKNAQQAAWQPQKGSQPPMSWDYKYHHFPCTSPCDPSDMTCLKVEALFQNVLGYPRLPPKVQRFLEQNPYDIDKVTATVEALNDQFGKELVLYFVRRAPQLIFENFDDIMARAEAARSMLDLRPADLFGVLRKNPNLMTMDAAVVRARYNQLHRITPLNYDNVRKMTRKYPLILNTTSDHIVEVIDSLRQMSYTRVMWQENFDFMTPSLLAYFLRDKRDLLLRLEYLVVTGQSPTWTLTQVFKPSNNLFCKLHPGFRPWLDLRYERRRQQQERAMAAAARSASMQQQRLAAVAASASAGGRGSGSASSRASSSRP